MTTEKTNIEALRLKHADILNNKAVYELSKWKDENSNNNIEYNKLLERSRNNLKQFFNLFKIT